MQQTLLSTYVNSSQPQAQNSQPSSTAKRYRGQSPRKRVPGNQNYYDHNILGLGNRREVKENGGTANCWPLFGWAESAAHGRSQSQNAVWGE